jgi:hypothetical protein
MNAYKPDNKALLFRERNKANGRYRFWLYCLAHLFKSLKIRFEAQQNGNKLAVQPFRSDNKDLSRTKMLSRMGGSKRRRRKRTTIYDFWA